MTKIFVEKSAAFYKFAVSIEVPTMQAEDFNQSFKDIFYSRGVSIPNEFAKDIELISQGIPYYMVRIAQQVLIDALLKNKLNTYCYSIRIAALKVYKKNRATLLLSLVNLEGKSMI